jgi:hypothetical protein
LPRNPIGRPTKFTKKIKEDLIRSLKAGSYIEPACVAAGITYQTYKNWMDRGEGIHPTLSQTKEYFDFFEEVTRAIAEGEVNFIKTIKVASAKDWRAAAWALERRHSDRWANTQRIQVEVEKQLDKEREKEVRAMEKLMPEGSYNDYLVALAAMGKEPEPEQNGDGDE